MIGDGDGKRLIVLHAMTDNGLVATPDATGSDFLNEPALTAELVFEEVYEDGQDEGDYHNTMTGVKFVAWLRNRLLATFDELHAGKKMLPGAGQRQLLHKPRDESWVSGSKVQNKHNLAHKLLDLGVMQLTPVHDSSRLIPAHKFEHTRSNGGPSKEDLLVAVHKWLEEHPDHNRTVVEQLMTDAGHTLVYTPPFCPEVQPAELLWASIKGYVAESLSPQPLDDPGEDRLKRPSSRPPRCSATALSSTATTGSIPSFRQRPPVICVNVALSLASSSFARFSRQRLHLHLLSPAVLRRC